MMPAPPKPKIRQHDAARTRGAILLAAFAEIHLHGFQGASIDKILTETELTKGALYYHFPNKLALGYAVVDELIGPHIAEIWALAENDPDPIKAIKDRLSCMTSNEAIEACIKGCPLNNLMQEMSPIDEGFRIRLQAIIDRWATQLERIIQNGMDTGQLKRDLCAREVGLFIIASIEGATGLAKNAQSYKPIDSWQRCLYVFLDSLCK